MTFKTVRLAFALLLLTTGLAAQDLRNPMADPSQNFYDLQRAFQRKWGREEREMQREQNERSRNQVQTGKGASASGEENEVGMMEYMQYKRWEYYMAPRVYPSGDLTLPSTTWTRFEQYLQTNPDAMQQYQRGQQASQNSRQAGPNNSVQSSTWAFAGPTGAPTGSGAGRLNFVRFDPTTSNTIWVGAPDGGLWKSTNAGVSWTTNTDFLTSIGCTDVAINPTNTQIMYLGTGDGEAGDSYSIGVLKSTDGGVTWNTTGLNWTVNQGRTISRVLINPTNPNIVMAATSAGVWRTTDAGVTWTQVITTGNFQDMEFKPGDPNTVYAVNNSLRRSTDGGATWTTITAGLPTTAQAGRFSIAVTPANVAYVYILAASNGNYDFYGVYRSTDSGVTFTARSTQAGGAPNVLGWASAGNDYGAGGQGWYDLACDASQTNADEFIVGGVNIWRSVNGGTSWTLNAHWTGTGAPYAHADVHCIAFLPGSGTTYFSGCDGGLFKTTNNGGAWADLSNNLCIAQIYRIGLSTSNANYWITGHQDNGTNLKNGASYAGTLGGDGMTCFVDRTNNNVMYGEYYNGSFNRTTNGGGTWNAITTGLTGTAPWVTPWIQDPVTANTLWCGRTQVFKSTNQGTSWAQQGTLTGTGTIVDIQVAASNNQVIYACRSNQVWKSVNGGAAWTNVTGTLPVGSAAISRLAIKPTDPNTVLVTFSGYSTGNKVYKTTNGGTTWTNFSTGLPNLPANCVIYSPGTSIDAAYIGMDVGVYYIDNTFTTWQPYFAGLANVRIEDLEVYQATGKLRAASFGRGVWEVDIYNPGTLPPVAQFAPSTTITCTGAGVNFTDQSSFNPTTWSWTFPGGTPATATTQNVTGVTWSTPGTYTVSLTVTNANGNNTTTQVITVLGSQAPPVVEGFEATTFVPAGWTANNINNDGVYWVRTATAGHNSTASALFDNYTMDVAGARDEMWLPRLNLGSYTSCTMTFDVAFARYDATYTDTLQVVVSTDCGATWNSVYLVGGTTLATAPDLTTALFVPTNAQWRTETINLNSYVGQGSVLIAIRNRGHYGQGIYVDNINLTGSAAALPNAVFTASTTTVCAGTPVSFTDNSNNAPSSWTWTFPSGTPSTATTQNVASVVWSVAGTYTVTHTATNLSGTGTTTQVITVNALPTVATTATNATICSGGSTTLAATGASTYVWNPGNLTGASITVSPTTTTTYTVTGTSAAGCVNTATRTITVNTTPTVTATASSTTICSGGSTTLTGTGATTYVWNPGNLSGASITVNPTTTTTYTVTGTATNGCSSTATQLVTVNTTPTVTATASATTICSGASTTLTGTGASTYVWNPGNLSGASVTVNPTTTTTYTVTGTAANGCTATSTRLITVNPSPTVTATASSTTICSGSPTTLTGTGAATYVWNPGNLTGASVTVSPTTTTTYTLTGTAANGCTATSTQLVTVNTTPTVTTTATSTTICSGNSTSLTATGATTYLWNPGALTGASVTVSPTTTTTYTVTGTTGGCTGTSTRLITVNPSPTVTATASSTTICSGSPTTLTGTGAATYVWNPGNLTGASVTVSPTTTTTYTLTGTAANGCTATSTQLVTVNPTPTVTTTATSTTICSGNSTTLTATGGTTYVWNPGNLTGASVTVSPTTTTTYTVTGTTSGCSGTSTRLITVNPSPTVTTTASNATICSGSSTTLTGTGAATYVWNPGNISGSPVTVSPTTTTTYTVTGTAANGCTATSTRLITVNPSPTVTATASSTSICTGNPVTLSVTGAATYVWNPGNLTGASVTVTPTATTTYTVTGTAANGCTNVSTITITVGSLPTVTASSSNTAICVGGSATLTGGGAATYTWNPGNLSGASVTVSPTTTTTYTVTGSNGPGCVNTATVLVTVNALPTVSATTSNSTVCTGGSATLTASGAATYVWNPGNLTGASVTVNPAATTTYTVTGTSAAGCANTSQVTVTVNTAPTVSSTTSSSAICTGGSATLTASGAATYVWNPGNLSGASVSVNPTTTTTYTVTGTAANGCTATSTQLITVNPTPTVTATTSSSAICDGSSATLTSTGAALYTWNPGNLSGSSVSVNPTTTTTYTVTATSAAGCPNTATVTVTVNPAPSVTSSASSLSTCVGSPVTLTSSGATTYNWTPGNLGGSSVTVTPASTTTYTVTGTDANGCTNTSTLTITVGSQPVVTASSSNTSICVGSNVTLTASGATSYTWNPGNLSGASITDAPTTTTTYTVTGTNGPGCTNTATVLVTVNALPTVAATAGNTALCPGDSTTLTGSGASTYSWNPGNISGSPVTVTPASSTTYTVTGTDINGCANTNTVTVNLNVAPVVTASGNQQLCPGGATTLTASGATSYTWNPGNLTGAVVTVSPATTTTYTVIGTDANGCTSSTVITVTVGTTPATPTVNVAGNVLTSSVTGASYQWFLNGNPIAGATNQSYTATLTGSYTVIVYDVNGCPSIESQPVVITSIGELGSTEFFSLFPNPNDGRFDMVFNVNEKTNYVLEVFDALGQVVYREELNNFNGTYSHHFDLTSYGRGLYTIRLKSDSKDIVSKVITY